MKKLFQTTCISIFIFFLSSCATRQGPPAGVTDANAFGKTANGVQIAGIGNANNLVGKDAGPVQGVLGTRSFYFGFNKSRVKSTYIPIIKAHGNYLLQHASARVLLEGNTDSRGSREYNIALGQRRANAVAAILRMQGVAAKQIRTVSYGAEKPIALGHTAADYQINRRVDLRYVG